MSQTTIVQGAWERGQPLALHGWVYGIHDGLLHDLDMCASSMAEVEMLFQRAVARGPGVRARPRAA
jgi:carbonic anhydrase